MSLPSASRLTLAVTCPGSVALPGVGFASEAGVEGTALHELLDAALDERKRGDADQTAFRQASKAHHDWLSAVLEAIGDRLDGAASEVAYGYDPTTGRSWMLGSHLGRHYPPRPTPTCLVGTVDYVVEPAPGVWLCVDLKTGLSEETPVARNWQLRFAALAVASWHGATSVQTAILHAPRDGRRPWWEYGPRLDALELVEHQDELARAVTRMQAARRDVADGRAPKLTEGAHCARCPARLGCPTQTALLRRAAAQPETLGVELREADAAAAWLRLEAIEAVVREAKRQLYAFAASTPVRLPDGRVVGKHRSRIRPEVDADAARAWLTTHYGAHVADAAMEYSTNKSRIVKAIEAQAPRGQKSKASATAWQALSATGAVVERWRDDVGPYDPKDKNIESAVAALPVASSVSPADGAPVLLSPQGQAEES